MRGELSRDERAALQALDMHGLVALLRELIAIPSLDGQESAAQRRVAAWMRLSGFEVDEWQIDLRELARHPDWCHEVDRADALGVVGWYGEPAAGRAAEGGGAGTLATILRGHSAHGAVVRGTVAGRSRTGHPTALGLQAAQRREQQPPRR